MWAWSVGVGCQLFDFTHNIIQAFVSIVIALVPFCIFIFCGQILEQKQPLKRIQFALHFYFCTSSSAEIRDQNPNVGCVFEKVFILTI